MILIIQIMKSKMYYHIKKMKIKKKIIVKKIKTMLTQIPTQIKK